eukprot:jgi/Psemu1/313886/fgenesh1_kg.1334_\
MEAIQRSPSIPQLTLDVARSGSTPSESILDSTRLDPTALNSAEAAAPKKKRNPGERIQRR